MTIRAALLLVPVFASLLSCAKPSDDVEPPKQDWVIRSHVAFVEADGLTVRPVPKEPIRLWMPYVVGDLYGRPNAGELVPVDLAPDLSFTLNLNLGHLRLAKALVPTEFSQKWMTIEPAEARVARLSPWVMPRDGITPLGLCEWLDAETGERLMLVYLDRPARVRGEIVYEGRSLQFDIEVKEPGFQWIHQPRESGVFRPVPRPAKLVLGVLPH
jgi:hypothetical protein